jgi:hypothetical protein
MDTEKRIVTGKPLVLNFLDKKELKTVFVDAILEFSFYKATFKGNYFYLLISKRETKLVPLEYKQLADRRLGGNINTENKSHLFCRYKMDYKRICKTEIADFKLVFF